MDESIEEKRTPEGENLHAGHRKRMRNRFAASGFEGYQNHGILEQLLFFSCTRVNTNPIAHRLLERFGSLEGVLTASREELAWENRPPR